jgi:hypothetical protein
VDHARLHAFILRIINKSVIDYPLRYKLNPTMSTTVGQLSYILERIPLWIRRIRIS